MRKISNLAYLGLFIAGIFMFTSCTKEEVAEDLENLITIEDAWKIGDEAFPCISMSGEQDENYYLVTALSNKGNFMIDDAETPATIGFIFKTQPTTGTYTIAADIEDEDNIQEGEVIVRAADGREDITYVTTLLDGSINVVVKNGKIGITVPKTNALSVPIDGGPMIPTSLEVNIKEK